MRKAIERLRWRLWGLVVRHPKVCPANAHSLIIWGNREQRPWIGWMCRDDCERNGSCWCGKIRSETHPGRAGER